MGGAGLGGMGGGVDRERRNIERGADRGRAEHAEAVVVDRSVDWKASLVNCAWSIFRAATYQASGLVSAGRPNGMVAIWLWMLDLRPQQNFTTRVQESVYLVSETKVRKVSKWSSTI